MKTEEGRFWWCYAGTAVHEPRTEGIGHLHDTWRRTKSPNGSWRFFFMGKSWGNHGEIHQIRHGGLKKGSLMIRSICIHLLINHWKGFSKNDVDSVQISWFTAKLLDLAKINQQTQLRGLSLQVKHWNPLALSLVFLTSHGASILKGEFSSYRV